MDPRGPCFCHSSMMFLSLISTQVNVVVFITIVFVVVVVFVFFFLQFRCCCFRRWRRYRRRPCKYTYDNSSFFLFRGCLLQLFRTWCTNFDNNSKPHSSTCGRLNQHCVGACARSAIISFYLFRLHRIFFSWVRIGCLETVQQKSLVHFNPTTK